MNSSQAPFSRAHGEAASLNPFDPSLVTQETEAHNVALVDFARQAGDSWAVPIPKIREARARSEGVFPFEAKLDRVSWIEADGVKLRLVPPSSGNTRGVFLHIHGGGWTFGQADMHDEMLGRLADATGLAAVSVEYRLGPEHRFPAPLEDCVAAARWALDKGRLQFGDHVVIGGESAGAHLSLSTAIALQQMGKTGLTAMVLNAGCFDLSLTPSARNWGYEKLVLNTRDLEIFAGHYVPGFLDRRHPDVSPLYADLTGLPDTFVSVGTQDPLLDDTLFLDARLKAAGVTTELAVAPGGAHVFHVFDLQIAREAWSATYRFINERLDAKP